MLYLSILQVHLLVLCGEFTQQHEDVVVAKVPLSGCEEFQRAHCLPQLVLDANKPAHRVVTHLSVIMWVLPNAKQNCCDMKSCSGQSNSTAHFPVFFSSLTTKLAQREKKYGPLCFQKSKGSWKSRRVGENLPATSVKVIDIPHCITISKHQNIHARKTVVLFLYLLKPYSDKVN